MFQNSYIDLIINPWWIEIELRRIFFIRKIKTLI
jgi:hypothetical protein